MVTTFYPPYHYGGDAIYVRRLSRALADRGHQVEVIHCEDAFRLTGGRVEASMQPDPGIKVHRLKSALGAVSPLYTQQTGLLGPKRAPVKRIIEQGNFDVVHGHNISLMGGLELFGLGSALKLLSLHDYWLTCPTHIMFRDNEEACTKPECLRCQWAYKRPPQLWRSQQRMQRAMTHLDCVLSSSRFASALLKERGFDLPTRFLPLLDGMLETSPDGKSERELPEQYFLFVGRLEKLKGLQDVIPWFTKHSRFNLVIAGSGQWEEHLKQLARGASNICFLGQQSQEELSQLYAGATATVMPSLCYEIAPLVLGESWSQGTPVIARRIGALEEHVEESGCGCLFESIDEFGEAVKRMAADPDWRNELAQASFRYHRENMTTKIHVDHYLAVVEELRNKNQTVSISP